MRVAVIVGLLASLTAVAPASAQSTPRLAIDLMSAADPPAAGAAGEASATSPGPVAARGPSVRALDILSDGQTRDLLLNGFPARLHFRIELWHAGGLFNAIDGTREWDVIVRYDPVTKRFRAARLHDDTAVVIGDFDRFATLAAAIATPLVVPLAPARHGGRYYYNAVLDVEMLTLNDLAEVERWLRGELGPAVRGKRNPTGVIGRGLRTLFVHLLGAERRHYEVR